ncbi:hypothetical protein phytr_12690 [Candidatus Phycorickettsia trachydisci]|uniref:Uncharacterized protein n=1 Tax=Candidatus Phycorickettsia trachydisci TaxID=2115978 RepID=A0A2P1PAA0_9RICK|nr:hypothetical protein [Candidatus Phycorickettsia trachydisci]AVP88193.1 hypothetical protein phytr_12690 [Candidatus Phycorickettsia trachydisci]
MLKPKQQKMIQNLKLHNRVTSDLKTNHNLLIGALRLLLVHSIQDQSYLETVKAILNFFQVNLEQEGILSMEVKKSIAENLRISLRQATDEICSMINNSRPVGFSVSLEKFKLLFKFLSVECAYEFLGIQIGIEPEYFLERILINKVSYRNYCAKKCKGININDSKYNPNTFTAQAPCFTDQYLADMLHKLLIGQALRNYEIERLFDIPNLASKLNPDQEKQIQKRILNDAMIYWQLVDSIDELQKFTNIVTRHPTCIKDYPFLLKNKILLLDNHNTEAVLKSYLSPIKLELLRDLIVDIKNTVDKIPPQEIDLNLVTLVKNISGNLERFCFEKHFNGICLELKSISFEMSGNETVSTEDAILIALTLFRSHGADDLISLRKKHLLEKCIKLLEPYLLLDLLINPGVFSLHAPINRIAIHHMEKDKLLDWFILNRQVQKSNERGVLSVYKSNTNEILESLPQSSLLFILMKEKFTASQAMFYAYNNDIIRLQDSLDEVEECPSIGNTSLNVVKANLVSALLENQEITTIDPAVCTIVDSINFGDSQTEDQNQKFQENYIMCFIYRELSNRISHQDKAIKYFNKALKDLRAINAAHLESRFREFEINETNVRDNQAMAILAIKYGLDYQEYMVYIEKVSRITKNQSLIADIYNFKRLVADIEEYKSQIDFVDLVSKVAQNNSISKLSKSLRDEFNKEIAESKLLLQQEEALLLPLTESVEDVNGSSEIAQTQDATPQVSQHKIKNFELITNKATPTQSQAQNASFVKIDHAAIAIKAKSNEIAYHLQQIFQKSKEAKKAIWHEIIPSWSIDGQKYTSTSPEVVGIWDNIYAIISPQLLSSMSKKIREQCENAFYKGYATRFKGSNGFKLVQKLVWELKCNLLIRWAVKSKDIDVITKAVLLIVDHQTDHEGIENLVKLKRTGKIVDTITYSNLSPTDKDEKLSQADYDLGYGNVDTDESVEDIEYILSG